MDWMALATRGISGQSATEAEALAVLHSPDDDLLAVLHAAFVVRKRFCGRRVNLHVIENVKSGGCTEDCAYCSQAAGASADIPQYPLEAIETIVEGARRASRAKAVRYCIVSSGREPDEAELDRICEAARRIRSEMPISICTSLGLLTEAQARRLAESGVNRYNHNLETAPAFFPRICGTHTYEDRVHTLKTAKGAGLEICCGGLIGMGESDSDRVALAFAIRDAGADSVPINFLDPRPGTALENRNRLSPADGLRVLCMFRFAMPEREIRVAGGREACLRSVQPLALYPANSMFTEGYLTTEGQGFERDRAMIREAGFELGDLVSA